MIEPDLTRPYRAPLYPFLPGFALTMAFVALTAMIYYNFEIFVIFAVIIVIAVMIARLRYKADPTAITPTAEAA